MATRHGTADVTLPSDTEILITRRFEAPAHLVWEAFVTPRHLLRWWGPDWCPLVAADVDLRPGGRWRYVARRADDGEELAWRGVYQEVEVGQRLVSTEIFEGYEAAESLNTMTLEEEDGVTVMRVLVRHTSQANRDGHVDSGMESGMENSFGRLDHLLESFGSPSERWHRVAGRFTRRAQGVPLGRWDDPAPCEGWTARDVVRHMVEWMPSFATRMGVELPASTSVDDDPVAAWVALADGVQAVLDDPEQATREFDEEHIGHQSVASAIDMIFLGDVLVHTWDLARATGQDESLDPEIAAQMLAGMEPIEQLLRDSGQYGPRVHVPESADVVTRLVAFTGRTP